MSRARDLALRAALALAFALPLALLWSRSPVTHLAPPYLLAPALTPGLALGVVAWSVAFIAAARHASTLAWTTGFAAAVLLVLLYPHAHLDWSRLLKDWQLVRGAGPLPAAVALAVVPFAAAWALHVHALRRAAAARFAAKGVPSEEVQRLDGAVVASAKESGGVALAATAALVVTHTLTTGRVENLPNPLAGMPFFVPIAAAGVVALVVAWLVRRRTG